MSEFMVHHTHGAEECERIFSELKNVDQSLKGKSFFCTCPSGDHGGFFRVEAASSHAASNLFPAVMRDKMSVYAGEAMDIP